MKRTPVTLALAIALLTTGLGLSACDDEHPDRGDRHGTHEHGHDHDNDHDRDHDRDHHDQ